MLILNKFGDFVVVFGGIGYGGSKLSHLTLTVSGIQPHL